MLNINNLRIVLTGGAGFIGSHLGEHLVSAGAQVAALDNFDPYYPRSQKDKNIEYLATQSGWTLHEGDIRDRDFVQSLIRQAQPDILVHLAARAGVRPSILDPVGYTDVNVNGTTMMLEAARDAGVRRFIFASSSSVYGNQGGGPLSESLNTDNPLSPYGATKKAGEALCHSYHHIHGMSIACLRFFTVYGPRQRPDLAIRKFVTLAMNGEELPVFGDGSSRRDYTHIADIVTGILGSMRWVSEPEPRYGIFNLGSSHPIALRDLLEMIEQNVGKPLRRKILPPQPGDVYQTYADTSRAEAELGFHHAVDFADGLKDFIKWMKANA